MKDSIKIVATLSFVCVICAFFLAMVSGLTRGKIAANQKLAIYYILYSLLHLTHLTFTPSKSRRSNFFEPQFVQIGHARAGFTNNSFVNYI